LFNNKYVNMMLTYLKYISLVLVIPPLINYAALSQEQPGTHHITLDLCLIGE
jgi:hypothetical protein